MRRLGFFQKGENVNGDESARIIGAIEASQVHTEAALTALRDDHSKLRGQMTEYHVETTKGFGEVATQVAVLDQKLDTHIQVYEDGPKKGSRTAAKATGYTGLGGGAVVLGNWIWDKITGG